MTSSIGKQNTKFHLEIKPITIEYLTEIQDLLIKGSQETDFVLANNDIISNQERFRQIVIKWSESEYEFNLGAFVQDENSIEKLIGHIHFRIAVPHLERVKHIGNFNMLILKEYWGQGIGQKLIKATENKAKGMGVKRIEAQVITENQRAVSLYKKCGFSIEGTRRKSILIKDRLADEYYIGKIL